MFRSGLCTMMIDQWRSIRMWTGSMGVGTEAHDVEGIFEVPRRAVGKDRGLGGM